MRPQKMCSFAFSSMTEDGKGSHLFMVLTSVRAMVMKSIAVHRREPTPHARATTSHQPKTSTFFPPRAVMASEAASTTTKERTRGLCAQRFLSDWIHALSRSVTNSCTWSDVMEAVECPRCESQKEAFVLVVCARWLKRRHRVSPSGPMSMYLLWSSSQAPSAGETSGASFRRCRASAASVESETHQSPKAQAPCRSRCWAPAGSAQRPRLCRCSSALCQRRSWKVASSRPSKEDARPTGEARPTKSRRCCTVRARHCKTSSCSPSPPSTSSAASSTTTARRPQAEPCRALEASVSAAAASTSPAGGPRSRHLLPRPLGVSAESCARAACSEGLFCQAARSSPTASRHASASPSPAKPSSTGTWRTLGCRASRPSAEEPGE
mmetsp:Transcript_32912/g.83996  ORF Transcript_32912/g.83996 Transcript_32912/m.83996 type:complete len:381 (-) Transcript_32912:81-1223(-)